MQLAGATAPVGLSRPVTTRTSVAVKPIPVVQGYKPASLSDFSITMVLRSD